MTRPLQIVLAGMLVTFVLGSVHAFSVFLQPLETSLQLPRSDISLVYSIALVSITLAVTVGYRFYGALAPGWLVSITGLVAAGGLWLAADAESWWQLVLGYSLGFGFANGVGYGYCLQLAGLVMAERRGMAMGAVTAAYAVGSILFARLFAWRIEIASVGSALSWLALAVLCACVLAALVMYRAGARYPAAPSTRSRDTADRALLLRFWFAYLTGVFAGLMAIGHAAGIAQAEVSGFSRLASWAAVTVGCGSALGGFVAGGLVDRWPVSRFLVGLPLLSAIALAGIGMGSGIEWVLVLLSVVGFAYGAIIAIYPVAIAHCFGEAGARAYGRVFLAWGFAGLSAPWLAGAIFDWRGGYEWSMWFAAVVALLSAGSAALFRLGKTGERLANE